jgi:hypothetical protein
VYTKNNLYFPLILPIATPSMERCFFAMSLVKSVLRNKMGDKYMSESLIFYVEKDIFSTTLLNYCKVRQDFEYDKKYFWICKISFSSLQHEFTYIAL